MAVMAPRLERVAQTPFARRGQDHALGSMPLERMLEFARHAARVAIVIEINIVDGDSHGPLRAGTVPHDGEDEGELLLVVADACRLPSHFRGVSINLWRGLSRVRRRRR